jgi:RecJ-like exonuclease
LITAILGTAVLLLLSKTLEPRPVKISEIDDRFLEQYVRVQGNVSSLKLYEGMVVASLEDETGKIQFIAYNLKENLTGIVQITGKIKEYHGRLEIEASRIKAIEET